MGKGKNYAKKYAGEEVGWNSLENI